MIPNNQLFYSSGSNSVSVLQPWYDSLIVKPSAGLWTDLKLLADGMNSDGDWDEMDLIGITAAMETDEQRLRPLKTTSGLDMIATGGALILNSNGIRTTSSSVINMRWIPSINGVKYTLNSAYIGFYGETLTSSPTDGYCMGSQNIADDAGTGLYRQIPLPTEISNRLDSVINNNTSNTLIGAVVKTGLLNAIKRYYLSIQINSSTQVNKYINGQTLTAAENPPTGLSDVSFYLLGFNYSDGSVYARILDYTRACIIGSSLIDSDRVAARLNTFFTSRGLSIANY